MERSVENNKPYMVNNNDEDAYRLKKLSLFTVEYDCYLGQKNKRNGKNCNLRFSPMSGDHCKAKIVLQYRASKKTLVGLLKNVQDVISRTLGSKEIKIVLNRCFKVTFNAISR